MEGTSGQGLSDSFRVYAMVVQPIDQWPMLIMRWVQCAN